MKYFVAMVEGYEEDWDYFLVPAAMRQEWENRWSRRPHPQTSPGFPKEILHFYDLYYMPLVEIAKDEDML